MKRLSSRRPWVAVNFAMTWDGRISTRRRTPSDFSSKRDKRHLLELRARADAVLAGAATVAADNMTMGLPGEELHATRLARGQPAYPLRVLLSNSGRIDPQLRLFSKDFSRIVIFSGNRMPQRVRAALQAKADLRLSDGARVDLAAMLHTLATDFGVRHVDCEGGGRVFRSLLEAGLVDELHLTLCPRVFGGEKAPTITGVCADFLSKSVSCSLQSMKVTDGECFLRYRVRH